MANTFRISTALSGLLMNAAMPFVLRLFRGASSRIRVFMYRQMGARIGNGNRIEGGGRWRRCGQIEIGAFNTFSQGSFLWPLDTASEHVRIHVGNGNYFNRSLMIDACGYVKIGDDNMIGPDVYITDSNHQFGTPAGPKALPMNIGQTKIGNRCWIGAKAVILKNVELGDGCVVGAGAVVTRSVAAGIVVAGIPARPLHPSAFKL